MIELFQKQGLIDPTKKRVVSKLPDSILLTTSRDVLPDVIALHNWCNTGLFAKTVAPRGPLVVANQYTPATRNATFKGVMGQEIASISGAVSCDTYMKILDTLKTRVSNDLAKAQTVVYPQANDIGGQMEASTDPVKRAQLAQQGLDLLATISNYWYPDAESALVAAQAIGSAAVTRGCPANTIADNLCQIQRTVQDIGDLSTSFNYSCAVTLFQNDGALFRARQAQTQQDQQQLQSVAQCLKLTAAWYGCDIILNEDCTQKFYNWLSGLAGGASLFVSWTEEGGSIAAVATLDAAAPPATVVIVVVAALGAAIDGFAQALASDIHGRDNGNGVTLHFSLVAAGITSILTSPFGTEAIESVVLLTGGGGGFMCEFYQFMWISAN